MCEQIEK